MKHLRAAFPKESAKTFQNLSFDFGNSHIRCQLLQFALSELFAIVLQFALSEHFAIVSQFYGV